MIEITSEEFNNNIDYYFDIVNHGQMIKIKTEQGAIIVLSEVDYNRIKE